MVGSELNAFNNATNRKFQRQIVGFVTRHRNDAEDFMVVCLRCAAQQQANRQAGGKRKTDFIRILLVGRGRG